MMITAIGIIIMKIAGDITVITAIGIMIMKIAGDTNPISAINTTNREIEEMTTFPEPQKTRDGETSKSPDNASSFYE
uniref:Putative secreted protein n=1 Tax=Anopheles darlingi TaxID=43151 RepID=A0A2M4D2U6_ANODA